METANTENVSARTAKRWGLIAFLLAVPLYFAVDHFGGSGIARASAVAFGIMVIVIRAFWNLRRRIWYWVTIGVLTIIQLVMIIAVPWTAKDIPAPILWPVGIADFVMVCLLVKLVEKLVSRSSGSTSTY